MAGHEDLVVIVDDLVGASSRLRTVLLAIWPPQRSLRVHHWSHKTAFLSSDEAWERLAAGASCVVLVDAHDLSREREWHKGERNLPFPLAGADVGKRILALRDPPRLVMYSDEIENPIVNVALREATDSRAAGYYTAEAMLDPTILRSAIFDARPAGQFPAPTNEDLTIYAGTWDMAHEALLKGPHMFSLLSGGEEAIRSVRALPTTMRNTRQKALRRLRTSGERDPMLFQRWDDLVRKMQEAVGLRSRRSR